MEADAAESLRRAKADATAALACTRFDAYKLARVDARIDAYVRAVAAEPAAHNLFEQLAVLRFLTMCRRYGLNATEVRRFFTLYELLYFPGTAGITRYRLTPVQAFQFASIYGFWDGARRVVREAALFVPRKFSKTTSCAAVAVQDLLYGDANAESYTAANSNDQAKKCFDVIRGCMRKLDPDGRRYVVNEQTIKSRRPDRGALAQCLTANARTKDGLNASTVIMDEFSQARDSALYTVLTTSMGTRANPLTMIITTASDVFDGPFYSMLQGYKALLLGEYEDDSVFAHLFMPDVDDEESDEATWTKVHPHIGVTVSIDYYREQWRKAMRHGAEAMLAFRTKLLNVYAENTRRAWIGGDLARRIAVPIDLSGFKGRPDAMVAIDLSESDDLSAVSLAIYDEAAEAFYFHTAYFFPEGAVEGHPNEALYSSWARQGHLTLTPGDVIDYRSIVDYVLRLDEFVCVQGIGYDPWKSLDVVNMLAAAGGEHVLRGIKQTYGYFTAPVQSFEHGAKTGRLFINDNPINYYCFANAVLDFDTLDNCKPVKIKHTQKIDGVITKLMCLRMYMDWRE